VFDFDGVLGDSVSIKTWAFSELYKNYGVEVTDKVVEYHLKNGGMSRFKKFDYYHSVLLGKKLTQATMDSLNKAFSELVIDAVIKCPEVTGSRNFLKHYSDIGRILCVNSATPLNEMEEIIRKRDLGKFFNGVYGSPKSKTDNLNEIFSTFNTTAEDTVLFGDALADLEAAESVGCSFIGVGESFESHLEVISFQSNKDYGFLKDFSKFP
jgi:beta-phosphoglucomutase-like phosphatase (HAD superfamily)